MGRLGSGKTKGSVFPGIFDPKLGTFNTTLVGLQLYHSDNYQDKNKLELNLGFILDIDDPEAEHEPGENGLYRHTESFVRLQYDDEGNFGPGGTRAKAYKLLAAYYGANFNAFDENFEWWFDFFDGVEFDSIADIPHFKSYQQNEEWLQLADIFINPTGEPGKERGIMGNGAMVEFGHAQKPDKTYSEKISIINAIALPKSRTASKPSKAAPAKAPKPAPKPEPEEKLAPVVQAGAENLPGYITKVRKWASELGVTDEDFQPWFEYFLDEEITSPTSFSKEQAKTFKTAYDNDSDQIVQSYTQYKEFIQPAKEVQEDDPDFWEDEEVPA